MKTTQSSQFEETFEKRKKKKANNNIGNMTIHFLWQQFSLTKAFHLQIYFRTNMCVFPYNYVLNLSAHSKINS